MKIDNIHRKRLGALFYSKRMELGLSQMEMEDLLAEYNVAISTYKRAEHGFDNVSEVSLIRICEALHINLLSLPQETRSPLLQMKNLYEYVNTDSRLISFDFYVFLLYLPLIPIHFLKDFLNRIQGSYPSNRFYINEQLNYLYDNIPESEAKKYADWIIQTLQKEESLYGIRRNEGDDFFDDIRQDLLNDELKASIDAYLHKITFFGFDY